MGSFGCKGGRERQVILFAQLGTPDAPTPKALRRYLREFLGDPRVIEVNRVLWWFILQIILIFRPKRSAALYANVFVDGKSPLLDYTEKFAERVKNQLQVLGDKEGRYELKLVDVKIGMRYGNPNLVKVLEEVKDYAKIILVPMFPQYSSSTTGSILDLAMKELSKLRVIPALTVLPPYYRKSEFIKPQADLINRELAKINPERLILSFHGVPIRYVDSGDVYCCHCLETVENLKPYINFDNDKIIGTFQSRFGKEPWLNPYTDEYVEELAKSGVKSIAVACPAFVADCLETIDEIGRELEHSFKEAGGEELHFIPCLNLDDGWVRGMADMVAPYVDALPDSCVTCPVNRKAS